MSKTTYQPTPEEIEIVNAIAAKMSELQLLLDAAAKNGLKVAIDPLEFNYDFSSVFARLFGGDDSIGEVKAIRLSWSIEKVQVIAHTLAHSQP